MELGAAHPRELHGCPLLRSQSRHYVSTVAGKTHTNVPSNCCLLVTLVQELLPEDADEEDEEELEEDEEEHDEDELNTEHLRRRLRANAQTDRHDHAISTEPLCKAIRTLIEFIVARHAGRL